MIIHTPNKDYTGVVAGVAFANGKGETDDTWLIQWFERNGYTVEKPKKEKTANKKTKEELEAEKAKKEAEAEADKKE